MGNNVHDFDLHVEVGREWYCGDTSITCEVTFPSPSGQPSITIDYDKGNDGLEEAIARAIKDIAAYMHDPEKWEKDYIEHSSEDWRKLKEAQENIEEYRKSIAYHQGQIDYNQKWIAENEAKIAALQARIESENKPA